MNTLEEIFSNKTIKPKERTETLSKQLMEGEMSVVALVDFAQSAKDPIKAACLEALEIATQYQPQIIDKQIFMFAVEQIKSPSPAVKRESSRIVANVSQLFINELDVAVKNLLDNSEDDSTVVRWAASFALGEIIKLKTPHNEQLILAAETIVEREENNAVRNNYLKAIKKSEKLNPRKSVKSALSACKKESQ